MSTAITLANNLQAPGDNLESYLAKISTIEILSPEQERELATKWFDEQDVEAARQLVLRHLRFVVHIARGYSGYGLPHGDLIQEGNVGLMKAVRRFNPNVGVRLVSFAVYWIKSEIHEYILRNWRIVKVATTKAQRKMFFNLRSSKKTLGWLNDKEATAIAQDLNVDKAVVLEMESRLTAQDASFSPMSDDDEEDSFAPANYLSDKSQDPALLAEEDDDRRLMLERMRAAIPTLDARTRQILYKRWLKNGKTTLQELADEYGISPERVRQIEKQAVTQLRAAMAGA